MEFSAEETKYETRKLLIVQENSKKFAATNYQNSPTTLLFHLPFEEFQSQMEKERVGPRAEGEI